MIIERIDHYESFLGLRTAWEALYREDPEAQYFLSFTWLSGVLASHPGAWLVLVARGDDGSCLGVLPLHRTTLWSKSRKRIRNEIEFAGRLFWADYGGFLCRPEDETEVLPALASHLKRMSWSHFYLKGFRVSDHRCALFMGPFNDERLTVEPLASLINDGATDNLVCPYLDLPDTFDAYLEQSVSPNTRQKIRRFLRKVESSPEYRLTVATPETAARDLAILEDLWRTMWAPLKGSKTERLASTYRAIVARSLDDGGVHMPVLWRGERAIGLLASFVDQVKSRLLFFLAARDESVQDLPVGLVLHACNIRWAIENGMRSYDLLRGDEPYKRSLGATESVTLRYLLVRTRSGANLNGVLDPGCLAEALGIVQDRATGGQAHEALTGLYQALSTIAGDEAARRLLDTLSEDELP